MGSGGAANSMEHIVMHEESKHNMMMHRSDALQYAAPRPPL